jgi:glucan phosphorylase
MSALEQEIIEKFQQLEPHAKQRVRALIEQEIANEQKEAFDFDEWVRRIESFRREVLANKPPIDAVAMLREIRDGEDE